MSIQYKTKYWPAILSVSFLLIIGTGLFFYQEIFSNTQDQMIKSEQVSSKLKKLYSHFTVSAPLYFEGEHKDGVLSWEGVFTETNRYRQEEKLQVLSYNYQLEMAAKTKLDDMFKKNYFAHISETGEGPSDLANDAHYEYILVGENLALGNFSDDQELVKAWMDSPGHRENIMSKSYREIGIAVGRGLYDGKMTWLAVQEFGVPTSVCVVLNESEELLINVNKEQLAIWDNEIKTQYKSLANIPKESYEYNQAAISYNALVDRYNNLSKRTKNLVVEYNKNVEVFNKCVEKFKL
jgi:uncharacterized protein YkwD